MSRPVSISAARDGWVVQLEALALQPLALCPEFPAIARRWEAWWRFAADRPLLVAFAPKTSALRWDKALDLLEQPEEWLAVRRRQVENMHRVGEALPALRVDIGPVAIGAFLGAPLHIAAADQTTWQSPLLKQCSDATRLHLRPDNRWWRIVGDLLTRTAQDAAGRYLVCLPDLSGAVDVLASLRGTEDLCLDLYEQAAEIRYAAEWLVDIWETVFVRMHEIVLGAGAGVVQWLLCWSSVPYTLPTCDFNALISTDHFRALCLPSLRAQARRAGRCLFHLDGPTAARHAPALAEEPAITAVQYTPGAATPEALPMLDMYRRLQQAGKPLILHPLCAEIPALLDALDPRGLALIPADIQTPQQADALLAEITRRFSRPRG